MTEAPGTGPDISVVIPHLSQPEHLRRCLASLRDQRDAPPHEIIVVDNGSPAPPEALCAEFGARLLHQPAPGPGLARNAGVAASRAPILAFIDADCRADPGWLAAIAARFADSGIGILGGDVRIARADPARPTLLEAYESVYAYRMEEYIRRQGFTGTGNLAIRREVFDAVGPFGGIGIAEDRDWGQRARTLGHITRYAPEMRVHHPARPTFADLALKWDRQTAHDFARVPAGAGARLKWLARAAIVAGSPAPEIVRILRSDRVEGPRARGLAFAGLLRIRLHRARRMLMLGLGADPASLSGSWNRR
jgi:cellulose synthase/poly-beta-1,6-N-acetylglucosamine synthase-like glycosyltransferase